MTQKGIAEVMEVSLDRVKSITSGKVQKLTREEGEALIRKLHVRGDWLATGEGPMLQGEGERELHRRLDAVKGATSKSTLAGLTETQRRRLQEILFFADIGDAAALDKLLGPATPDEQLLLERFRVSAQELRDAALRVLLGGGSKGAKIKSQINVGTNHGQTAKKIVNKKP